MEGVEGVKEKIGDRVLALLLGSEVAAEVLRGWREGPAFDVTFMSGVRQVPRVCSSGLLRSGQVHSWKRSVLLLPARRRSPPARTKLR